MVFTTPINTSGAAAANLTIVAREDTDDGGWGFATTTLDDSSKIDQEMDPRYGVHSVRRFNDVPSTRHVWRKIRLSTLVSS